MSFEKLFELVDGLIGDKATLRGMTFTLDGGLLTIDTYTAHNPDELVFICDYTPNNAVETHSFSATGVDELKDQIEYFILKRKAP